MRLFLVCDNLLLEGLKYSSESNLENIRMIRPLSIEGEKIAQKISELKELQEIEKIYSSQYSSSLNAAKYLAQKLELDIEINENFNDCKVGNLGSKNMKMVKGLQDHEFSYKLPSGESLVDVGNRLENAIKKMISLNENIIIYTHKRAILGFLLKHAKVGYNLDENLILEYNGNIIYDDSDTNFDVYEIIIENGKIIDIKNNYSK